jgi:hypothetical protein
MPADYHTNCCEYCSHFLPDHFPAGGEEVLAAHNFQAGGVAHLVAVRLTMGELCRLDTNPRLGSDTSGCRNLLNWCKDSAQVSSGKVESRRRLVCQGTSYPRTLLFCREEGPSYLARRPHNSGQDRVVAHLDYGMEQQAALTLDKGQGLAEGDLQFRDTRSLEPN